MRLALKRALLPLRAIVGGACWSQEIADVQPFVREWGRRLARNPPGVAIHTSITIRIRSVFKHQMGDVAEISIDRRVESRRSLGW